MNHSLLPGSAPHHCDCGAETGSLPVLDAASLPPAIRHGSIMGAIQSLAVGSGFELIAPHDPLPLLAQIEERWPGELAISYLERDTAWRIAIKRSVTTLA